MFIILSLLLGSVCFGIYIRKDDIEVKTNETIENELSHDTFCKSINNTDGVPNDVLKVIVNYMDDYFRSLYDLNLLDTSTYFSNEIDGQISNYAIKLCVESRKLYDFDFRFDDAYYILNIKECNRNNGEYTINFLEDDYFKFRFLNGISSEVYDIENTMTIKKIDGTYKITSFDKAQGYYMIFSENRNNSSISEIYDFYYDRLSRVISEENANKQIALNSKYAPRKSYDIKYDRNGAVDYVESYIKSRNENYYDFSDEGGNCQNLASQALINGGMLMDESGDYCWYYIDHLDYTSSWVQVSSFYDYCLYNDGRGLVADINSNIYYAEPGDLIQVGISSISHTTVVSKVIDGHILLSSNSIDMKDFPLEGYTYPVRKLIKILGSNK